MLLDCYWYLIAYYVVLSLEIMDMCAVYPTQRRTIADRQVRELWVFLQDLGKA